MEGRETFSSLTFLQIRHSLSTLAGKPYAIIQLGDPPELGNEGDDDNLDITSNSSVFGSTLKGGDTKSSPDFTTKLSTSKVTDQWDIEAGAVDRDKTSSAVIAAGGSENTVTALEMTQIRDDALAASAFWAVQSATNLTAAQHSDLDDDGGLTLTGATGGANVFNSTADFKITNETLTLDGGEGDFFVFNIFADQIFDVNNSEIELIGDIEPEEVLFNVLGSVGGGGQDDAKN